MFVGQTCHNAVWEMYNHAPGDLFDFITPNYPFAIDKLI